MSDSTKSVTQADSILIDLRNPWVAGLLAWLWPGAGHLYQRRYGKGLLFMGCILSLFVFGLILGQGRVVYAMHPGGRGQQEARGTLARLAAIAPLPFWLQAGTGLPAMPAVIQRFRAQNNQPPLFGGLMAPPRSTDELAIWQRELNQRFDMGVLYTMIAGILNFFVIWDAAAGPAPSEPVEPKKKDDKKPVDDKTPVTV
ncbi:hypothetical protein ETAA8_51900 [Anatilimnocola aggregata]|uniref:DUF6677 domain-containing protein n=1 Tax=Anatilimnocola aggregata TaxID=2528021 RepID=A0A517YIN7_9BACT|nr:DUF6677 family protein [Anatilimnocola aggregata]QDU30071.1 hypothetical protein ETAA8_51900 [Anatilimnocola aggregata]